MQNIQIYAQLYIYETQILWRERERERERDLLDKHLDDAIFKLDVISLLNLWHKLASDMTTITKYEKLRILRRHHTYTIFFNLNVITKSEFPL